MNGKRFLITGATGFIGSHLAGALAEEGHTVCLLIRPASGRGINSSDRWSRIADWLCLSPGARSRISVFTGDLDAPDLNLSVEDALFLKKNVDEILHAAASTSFSEKKRDEIFRSNITGLQNLMTFLSGTPGRPQAPITLPGPSAACLTGENPPRVTGNWKSATASRSTPAN